MESNEYILFKKKNNFDRDSKSNHITPNETPDASTSTPSKDIDDYSDALLDNVFQNILKILKDLQNDFPINKAMNLQEVLNILFKYEDDLVSFTVQRSGLNEQLKELVTNFISTTLNQIIDIESSFKAKKIKDNIQTIFDSLLKKIMTDTALIEKNFSFLLVEDLNDFEKITEIEIKKNTLKEDYYVEFLHQIFEGLKLESIPEYMVKEYKDKITVYIFDIISREFLNDFYEKYKAEQPEVKQMNYSLDLLLKTNFKIFDKEIKVYFNDYLIQSLFRLLYVSNFKYLKADILAEKLFHQKLGKFSLLMNIPLKIAKEICQTYDEIFLHKYNDGRDRFWMNNSQNKNNINKNIESFNENNNKNTDGFDEIEELKSLAAEIKSQIKSSEQFYMIIFSFSIMLNDVLKIENNKIEINKAFNVDSRQRQLLLNLLRSFNLHFNDSSFKFSNNNKFPFYLNSIVESFIMKRLIIEKKIQIFEFDASNNNKKIEIDGNLLIYSIVNDKDVSIEKNHNEYKDNLEYEGFDKSSNNIDKMGELQLFDKREKDEQQTYDIKKCYSHDLNKESDKKFKENFRVFKLDKDNNAQYNIENMYSYPQGFIDSELVKELNMKILEEYEKLQLNIDFHSLSNSIFSFLGKIISVPESLDSLKLDISKIKIRPLNNYIFSLNSSIFFSGFLSEGSDHFNAWKFFKFSLDEHKEMHSFEWPSYNYFDVSNQVFQLLGKFSKIYANYKSFNFHGIFDEIFNFKRLQKDNIFNRSVKIAKLCGKLLALVIARRKLFKIHTLNLIGFSLGCQVIKSFLKQLYELSISYSTGEYNYQLTNIIQNVVFMGGAVDFRKQLKWGKIFQTLVAGKVVNVYTPKDEILKKCYAFAQPQNSPIGLRKLEFKNCNKVINYDSTDKLDGHLDYRNKMDKIMENINFEL